MNHKLWSPLGVGVFKNLKCQKHLSPHGHSFFHKSLQTFLRIGRA